MTYVCRPGIVPTKICGEWLLIPTRAAAEFCPEMIRLSVPALLVWGILSKGKTIEDVTHALTILTKKSNEDVQGMTDSILQSFLKRNCIIPADQGI